MDDFYFSVSIDENRLLCLAPLTDRLREMAGDDVEVGDGYFLFERAQAGVDHAINVIARANSYESALEMRDMFGMS